MIKYKDNSILECFVRTLTSERNIAYTFAGVGWLMWTTDF